MMPYMMLKTLYTLTHGGDRINDVFGFPSKIGFRRFYIRLPVSRRRKKFISKVAASPGETDEVSRVLKIEPF